MPKARKAEGVAGGLFFVGHVAFSIPGNLILFLPQMIHALGVSAAMMLLVNAIPFAVAAAAIALPPRSAAKFERG